MKTAGVVFDFYDDMSGEVLKRAFPSVEKLPSIIKEAHILNTDEREVLRDEAYALVMLNEGKALRKFACVDAGNTLMSALYFLDSKDKLPEEAQKVAAANIAAHLEEFGLPVHPEIEKTASAQVRTRDPHRQPQPSQDANWLERTNLQSVQGNQGDSGKVMGSASQMKTASVPNMVDVSAKEAPLKIEKRASARTALDGKYALDSFSDVELAIDFFSWNGETFSPAERHEYCVKTAARADELGIDVPDTMRRYGSTEYAEDLDAHVSNRKALLPFNKEAHALYDELLEKTAEIEPELFATVLGQLDEENGLNWHYGQELADPFFVTFGGLSERQKMASWAWEDGDSSVTASQLHDLASTDRLGSTFDTGVVTAFRQDPIAIFESMPTPQKVIIARLANESKE